MKVLRSCLTCLSVIFSLTISAQVSNPAAAYKIFFEKVYLHTDRELYAAGEDIWFKAYLVNAQTNEPAFSSNNLYIELIAPDSRITQRKIFRLEKGLGNGDLHLSDSVPAGSYRLRAYTSWMRNFGDAFFFEKKIRVVSALAPAPSAAPSPAKKEAVAAGTPASARPVPAQNHIRFFPEGGSLIDGVTGMVAIRAEDASGKGIAATGSLISSSGEPVAQFVCDSTGMGSMVVPGLVGEQLRAEGNFASGAAFSIALAKPLLSGFSLFIKQTDSLFKVSISTNEATLTAQRGKTILLVGNSKGKVVYTAEFSLNSLQQSLSVPKAGFPRGIVAFTLYDADIKPQCERLVFAEGSPQARLTLHTNKPVYGSKEKVVVTLQATGGSNQPLKASLSLAAVDAGVIPVSETNIASYLDLSSELKGAIESPSRYFDERNPARRQQLDLLLLTQGWRDFTWKRLADSALRVTYPLEQGITVSGTVKQSGKNIPVEGANVTLSAPGARGTRLFGMRTDSAGRYYFDDVKLYGPQFLRLSSKDDKGEKNGTITLDSLFLPPPAVKAANLAGTATPESLPEQTAVTALIKRRETARKFSLSDTIGLNEVKLTGRKIIRLVDQNVQSLGYPDEVYTVDPKDYDHKSILHYLQHYSKAFVRDVSFVQDNYGNLVALPPSEPVSSGATISYNLLYYPGPKGSPIFPRIFVNGNEMPFTNSTREVEVMINYQQVLFGLPVDKAKKIEIKRMIGDNASDVYIIYLTLKDGALMPAQPYLANATLTGYTEPRTFFKPLYDTPAKNTDVRTTIHWEPAMTTNERGEAVITFYNADPATKIRIVAEGIAQNGAPLAGSAVYEVK
jgi:hypothetical protein